MNTPYLMVCVEKPTQLLDDDRHRENPQWLRWLHLSRDAKIALKPSETLLQLAENVWLFDAINNLSDYKKFVEICESYHAPCKSFLLESKPAPCK
jgi:hypothetical protein